MTYRDTKGTPLTFAEVDANFRDVYGRVTNINLAGLSALTPGADLLPYFTGITGTMATTGLTAFARSLLSDATQAAMQTRLGLVPTVGKYDTTVGRVLKVGDFGIGLTTMSGLPVSNLDDVTLGNGLYAVSSSTTGAKPATFGILAVVGRNNIVGSNGRVIQTFYETDTTTAPRIWNRVYLSNTSTWGVWDLQWSANNLVKTSSQTDTTAGSMLKVGDYGLGSTTVPLATGDIDALTVNASYNITADVVTGTFPAGKSSVRYHILRHVQYAATSAWQELLDRDNNTLYFRGKSSSTWSAWVKVWTDATLVKTTSQNDTTAGSMLKVGDFGIGALNQIAAGTDLNDITVPGMYGQPATANATLVLNYPVATAGTLFVQRGGASIVVQMYLEYFTGRLWTRGIYIGAPSAWICSWDTGNLAKTTTNTDTTAGRMLKVGDYGLGNTGGPPSVTDANSATTAGFYRLNTPYTNGPTAGAYAIIVQRYDNEVTQIAFQEGFGIPQLWMRQRQGASAWGNWYQAAIVDGAGVNSSIKSLAGLVNTPSRNILINGDFRIAQRGASVTVNSPGTSYGGPDRWILVNQSTGAQIVQFLSTITENGVAYPAVVQQLNTLYTDLGTNKFHGGIHQRMEGFNVQRLLGRPATLSFLFMAKKSATVPVCLRGGGVSFVTTFACVANTPIRVTIPIPTFPVGMAFPNSNANALELQIGAQNNGDYVTATQNIWIGGTFMKPTGQWYNAVGDWISVAECQLEIGDKTPFDYEDIAVNQTRCQRYFEVILGTVSPSQGTWLHRPYKVSKRSVPTLTLMSGSLVGASMDTSGGLYSMRAPAGALPSSDSDFTVYVDAEL
jgi:hypothetical protein